MIAILAYLAEVTVSGGHVQNLQSPLFTFSSAGYLGE